MTAGTATSTTATTTTTTTNDKNDISYNEDELLVLKDLRRYLSPNKNDKNNTDNDDDDDDDTMKMSTTWQQEHRRAVAIPVAAMNALLGVVERTEAGTMMGLQDELREASQAMLSWSHRHTDRSDIALRSGCELFLKHITRTFLELPNFEECRAEILERGKRFAGMSLAARDRIASVSHEFVQDGVTVLTHGWSRVVASLLLKAAETKQFDVVILEGRPDASGAKAAAFFANAGIPTTLILDAAMGYTMERVDVVLVGAEGVVENGGVVNKMGTYALATCARAHDKPFYVAAESYKFARLYPLNQLDMPTKRTPLEFYDTAVPMMDDTDNKETPTKTEPSKVSVPGTVKVDNPTCDYTPAKFITLLFTDIGVLTPSAVSDELIRLYQ